jgi:hypothetical protein
MTKSKNWGDDVNFEQGLRNELITISNLNNKVFPMIAPELTSSPYLIYSKTKVEYIKTFSGTQTTRAAVFEFDLLAQTYTLLQDLIVDVKNKLISIENRNIGSTGPFIESVHIDNLIEMYENLPKLYRANIEVSFYFGGV